MSSEMSSLSPPCVGIWIAIGASKLVPAVGATVKLFAVATLAGAPNFAGQIVAVMSAEVPPVATAERRLIVNAIFAVANTLNFLSRKLRPDPVGFAISIVTPVVATHVAPSRKVGNWLFS